MTSLFSAVLSGLLLYCLVADAEDVGSGKETAATVPGLKVLHPSDRQVFQRDDKNETSVPLACELNSSDGASVKVRAISLRDGKVAADWTSLVKSGESGRYESKIKLVGGWYRLEFKAEKDGAKVAAAVLEHTGVGEVFLTCGQSNSANYGNPCQKASDDRVSVCDWTKKEWRHCEDPLLPATGTGGSPWPLLGDILAKDLDVPVAFYSAGVGSTSVQQWSPAGNAFYGRIKEALQAAGPKGFRAILWHQGESDSNDGTSADVYFERLRSAIAESRKDAGYEVPWGVAIASFHPDKKATDANRAQVVAGQRKVIATVPGVFEGPTTDGYKEKGWLADGVHFNADGLRAHAEGWAKALLLILKRKSGDQNKN